MIKYTKSKPQCSYLKFRVSTLQATCSVSTRQATCKFSLALIYTIYIYIYVYISAKENFKSKCILERLVYFWLSPFMRFMHFVDVAQN